MSSDPELESTYGALIHEATGQLSVLQERLEQLNGTRHSLSEAGDAMKEVASAISAVGERVRQATAGLDSSREALEATEPRRVLEAIADTRAILQSETSAVGTSIRESEMRIQKTISESLAEIDEQLEDIHESIVQAARVSQIRGWWILGIASLAALLGVASILMR